MKRGRLPGPRLLDLQREATRSEVERLKAALQAVELRKHALAEAIRGGTPGGASEVVRAAERYLTFIKGKRGK